MKNDNLSPPKKSTNWDVELELLGWKLNTHPHRSDVAAVREIGCNGSVARQVAKRSRVNHRGRSVEPHWKTMELNLHSLERVTISSGAF